MRVEQKITKKTPNKTQLQQCGDILIIASMIIGYVDQKGLVD